MRQEETNHHSHEEEGEPEHPFGARSEIEPASPRIFTPVGEIMHPMELSRTDLFDRRIIAADTLLNSRHQVQKKHELEEVTWTPPSPNKYPDWFKWDEAFADQMFFDTAAYCWERAAIYEDYLRQMPPPEQEQTEEEINQNIERELIVWLINEFKRRAELYFKSAVEGLQTSFDGMDRETGFMPNSRVLTKSGVRQAGLERRISGQASVYTQPVLEPMAVLAGYKAAIASGPDNSRAKELLEKFYEPLKLHMSYYKNHLSDDKNFRHLLGIPHPHASGRDRDWLWLPDDSKIKHGQIRNIPGAIKDYGRSLDHTRDIVQANGDREKIREKFWDIDVMFNAIYLRSLYDMAEMAKLIGQEEDRQSYLELAQEVEKEMQTLWEPQAWKGNGAFVNINKDSERNKKVSVGNLFGFGLKTLTEEQLSSMMDLVETSFNTPYGIPCIPTDSPRFAPGQREPERIWHDGSSWANVEKLLVDDFCMQAERDDIPLELRQRCARYAIKVEISSNEALDRYWPPSEYRNSLTGEPLRRRANQFAWALEPRFMKARERLQYLLDQNQLPEAA